MGVSAGWKMCAPRHWRSPVCRLWRDGCGAGCQEMLLRGCPWPLVSETGTRASPAVPERRKRAASRDLHLAQRWAGPAAKGTQERTAPQAPLGGFPSPTVSSVGWVVSPPLPAPPRGSKHIPIHATMDATSSLACEKHRRGDVCAIRQSRRLRNYFQTSVFFPY